ncbi:T9SS type A sorting domain-containing protein [Winogradskyella sp.]|uniref:T9SS type A sorting domain-containing protein n=1 Tax=Winogradskyella sp. TaxID=1883156 RepID=UPI002634D48B|nr:T9SS type A sorting domain-containing protein [Winogradskyella sp.]
MSFVGAQNITTAEYYFNDEDLGFGLNNSFAISTASHTQSIDISGLSDGFNDIHIRVFDVDGNDGAGAWSHYDRATFYIANFATGQTIVDMRYRINNGDNINLGIDMPAMSVNQSYSIPVPSLSEGFYSLYIETQDSDGTWSHYDRVVFFISEFPTGQDIVDVRYRIDNDDYINLGVDMPATSISQSYSISVSSLSEGFHSLYVETQAADGTWSLYDRQVFFINNFSDMPSDVTEAEYFIDEDPGFGMGTSFDPSVMPLIATTEMNITPGDHLLCVRVRNADEEWSLYCCATFNVDPTASVDESLYESVAVNPNPFQNALVIEVSRQVEFNEIKIFDLTGKTVYTSQENLRQLNLNHLEAGTYILSLQTETEKATFKIIKQ